MGWLTGLEPALSGFTDRRLVRFVFNHQNPRAGNRTLIACISDRCPATERHAVNRHTGRCPTHQQTRIQSGRPGSNRRPPASKAGALPLRYTPQNHVPYGSRTRPVGLKDRHPGRWINGTHFLFTARVLRGLLHLSHASSSHRIAPTSPGGIEPAIAGLRDRQTHHCLTGTRAPPEGIEPPTSRLTAGCPATGRQWNTIPGEGLEPSPHGFRDRRPTRWTIPEQTLFLLPRLLFLPSQRHLRAARLERASEDPKSPVLPIGRHPSRPRAGCENRTRLISLEG